LKANQTGWPFLFQRVLTTMKILGLSVVGQEETFKVLAVGGSSSATAGIHRVQKAVVRQRLLLTATYFGSRPSEGGLAEGVIR